MKNLKEKNPQLLVWSFVVSWFFSIRVGVFVCFQETCFPSFFVLFPFCFLLSFG